MSDNKTDVRICVPGQRLCLSDKNNISGEGTYERQDYIYSQFAGYVEIVEQEDVQVIIVRSASDASIVPQQGDIVTAQVTLISQQFAKCAIKCIGDTVLSRSYKGIIRREDVRAMDKDKVEVYKSFRPGDVILARVLPITEAHMYQLSTAENELGVVSAHTEEGNPMVPIGWSEMQCPKTLIKQPRKVAKIVPESFQK